MKFLFLMIFLFSVSAVAETPSESEKYVLLQNCMAQAIDVTDDGSYEQFCINRYLNSD